jgi:hypothetical protein
MRACARLASAPIATRRRSRVLTSRSRVARAASGREGDERSKRAVESTNENFQRALESVMNRDWLSAGTGAVLCGGFFVWQGEDVLRAVEIVAAATVMAIVCEELLTERDARW